LIENGFVGKVLSTTLVARGGALQGSGAISDEKTYGYLHGRANGATMLTIPLGHTLAALRDVFGEVVEVFSALARLVLATPTISKVSDRERSGGTWARAAQLRPSCNPTMPTLKPSSCHDVRSPSRRPPGDPEICVVFLLNRVAFRLQKMDRGYTTAPLIPAPLLGIADALSN
jgi:hypothetical protein